MYASEKVPASLLDEGHSTVVEGTSVLISFHARISPVVLQSPNLVSVHLKPSECSWSSESPLDVHFYPFTVTTITQVSRSVFLYTLRAPRGLRFVVPAGHHVSTRLKKGVRLLHLTLAGASFVYRPYTPIGYSPNGDELHFFIKIYEDGVFTPVVKQLQIG